MVGGDGDLFEERRALLEALGSATFLSGDSGQITNVGNNMLATGHLLVAHEVCGSSYGVDDETLWPGRPPCQLAVLAIGALGRRNGLDFRGPHARRTPELIDFMVKARGQPSSPGHEAGYADPGMLTEALHPIFTARMVHLWT